MPILYNNLKAANLDANRVAATFEELIELNDESQFSKQYNLAKFELGVQKFISHESKLPVSKTCVLGMLNIFLSNLVTLDIIIKKIQEHGVNISCKKLWVFTGKSFGFQADFNLGDGSVLMVARFINAKCDYPKEIAENGVNGLLEPDTSQISVNFHTSTNTDKVELPIGYKALYDSIVQYYQQRKMW